MVAAKGNDDVAQHDGVGFEHFVPRDSTKLAFVKCARHQGSFETFVLV